MPDQTLVPVWSKGPKRMSDMRRLAKQVVDSMPLVQAAILFGSRARKTARRNSDWDVALLAPERCRDEVLRTAPKVPSVSYVLLTPRGLRERHNRLGTLERSVASDGVLLAGDWNMPESTKKTSVSYPNLANGLLTAAKRVDMAVGLLQAEEETETLSGDNLFCGLTQDTAERTVKAALLHLGIHPAPTHDVSDLADALRDKHPNHAWVERIESFNGRSSQRHVSDYHVEIMESIEESMARLNKTIEFHGEVLKAIAEKRVGFSKHLVKICNYITVRVTARQNEPAWDSLPEDLKQRLRQWMQMAKKFLN